MNLIKILENWYGEHKRLLPWRESLDPYHIWLSEIILQQTRVEQGLPYYERFLSKYPKIEDLAKAEDQEVYKLWEGLGYYNRCKNMLHTARYLVEEKKSEFPANYQELLKLKGIGPYTAAAIASIAFGEPKLALDGNLKRVLSRVYGIEYEVNSREFARVVENMEADIMPEKNPGDINQALMDLAASICTPRKPDCELCPIRGYCWAFENNKTQELPVKNLAKAKKKKKLVYQLNRKEGKVLLHQRKADGIWPNLFEFSLLAEADKKENQEPIYQTRHVLSHQILDIQIYEDSDHNVAEGTGTWVAMEELSSYAFPRPLHAMRDKLQSENQ